MRTICTIFFALIASAVQADPTVTDSGSKEPTKRTPSISLIIDDLGDRSLQSYRAVRLPGPVACAILPHTPASKGIAEEAHQRGKEVLLHLPMESEKGNKLGPGGLTLHMTKLEIEQTINRNLASIPHVTGVSNHMGSLLTRHPGYMEWVMQALVKQNEALFIDSRTSDKSVAMNIANEYSLASARRDVFLDNLRDPGYIQGQLNKLIKIAKENGSALGIGHPYPETMNVLEEIIPTLADQEIRLISLREHIKYQNRGSEQWRASLSR